MNRSFAIRIICALAAFLATAWLAAAATPADAPPVILIQNATVLTVTQGTIEHGSVLIKDGKITEVGPNVKVPSGAQVIDGTGMFVGVVVGVVSTVVVVSKGGKGSGSRNAVT